MTKQLKQDIFDKCQVWGPEEVRIKLDRGGLRKQKAIYAREWLLQQDSIEGRQRHQDIVDLMHEANEIAIDARYWANIAILIAFASLITEITLHIPW